MRRTLAATVLLVACDGGLDPMAPAPDTTVVGESPLIPPPDNPPEDTDDPGPGPSEECYANFTYAVDFLTTVTGTDLYDPVEPTRVLYQERDEGNDGTIDITVTFEYDTNGWLVAKTTDDPGHGTLLETWTHDAEGRDLLYVEDHGADGIPEHTIDRAYDAFGGLSWVSVDDDGDGLADLVLTWTRDAEGEPLTQDIDSDGDAVIDYHWTFSYDSLGRQIELVGDKDFDGTVNMVGTTTYIDPLLEMGETEMDSKDNGTTDQVIGFERDDLERPLWEGIDEEADGDWDTETFTTWDPVSGLLLETDTDIADTPDGPVHQTQTSTYDALGRRTSFHDLLVVNSVPIDTLYSWSFQGSCP